MNKKNIQVSYTEEERDLIRQLDNIDYRINKLQIEYKKERNSKYPNRFRLKEIETNRINIQIKPNEKIFEIKIPKGIDDEDRKTNVDRAIKKLFKINTEALIYNKLPYWSKKTKIEYTQFKIGDATSKYRKLYTK